MVRTLLLVDLEQDVTVDGGNEDVAADVEGSDAVQNGRVVEGDLLRHLHHSENDDQVDSVRRKASLAGGIDTEMDGRRGTAGPARPRDSHLGTEDGHFCDCGEATTNSRVDEEKDGEEKSQPPGEVKA